MIDWEIFIDQDSTDHGPIVSPCPQAKQLIVLDVGPEPPLKSWVKGEMVAHTALRTSPPDRSTYASP